MAQSNTIQEMKHNPNYEVKIDADSTAVIYNKQTNLRWLKSIKTYTEPENLREADLIIDLDTLNLVYWENLYRQWGHIDAANPDLDAKYIVADANKNGKNEIYSIHSSDSAFFSATIYENVIDSLFNYTIEIRDSHNIIYDLGDITNNGLFDIICRKIGNQLYFYSQNISTDYIEQLNFIYNPFPPVCQPNDVTFYDLDSDGIQEIIYYLVSGPVDSAWTQCNHVARYNPVFNNYELIYYHRPTPNWFTFGFATGDFDNDGKNNFSTGSIDGNYFIYEYVSGDDVNVEYQMQLETLNAFLSVMSEDMNGNGKNEVWIGSDFASSLYGGVTRVFVLEPSGNGTYQVVYQIDIRGLFSGIYGRIRYVDVDGDGIKEIFLNNGSLVFCFKYSPQRNFYLDFIIDTWDYSQYDYDGTDVADLDSDGITEFIMQKHLNPGYIFKSIFWKRDETVGVGTDDYFVPEEFNLMQNYPNPFNPSTTIRFALPLETKVNIKVYNILGKEITELLNETRISGEYEIAWNGTAKNGDSVPSGIYFITMIADEFSKTIKSILIK
ncbi:MAG: T9SS type A sorting domain-containing protein [bacterium]|nr:T9SS type A sorting domain-containing protein [bacterium]